MAKKEPLDILGEFLKSSRESVGLTQIQVAQSLGYKTAQFISNWERGISSPPLYVLKKLSELYKVSVRELFEVLLKVTIQSAELNLRRDFDRYFGKKKRA